jgi:hypothetical protein
MAGLLDEPYIGYPQLRRRSEQSLLGGTPRGLLNTTPSADTLRKLGEQLINIPTSATRAITDPQLFSRLLGITPNQQLSGFSSGFAGLPAKPPSDIGVVDPRNIDYSKGYSSGEEMGMMTALAAPLAPLARPVGRAVGEQAYRMTEDMLQSQGLMPSITPRSQVPMQTTNVGSQPFDPRFDKRMKEQDRLRNLTTVIEGQRTPAQQQLSLVDFEGRPFITSMADRTAAGGELVKINDVSLNRPVGLLGGQDYMFNNPNQVWASGQAPSKQIVELAQNLKQTTGQNPLYLPYRMTPSGGDFANMTYETMLNYAESAMSKADKKELNKTIKEYIPDWKGVDSRESIQQFRETPDTVRKEIMNQIDVKFRDAGGLNIGETRLAVADPKQLNAPDLDVMNIGEIFADQPLIMQSGHPSYPRGIPGQGLGIIDQPRNVFELLPNLAKARGITDPRNYSDADRRVMEMKPYGGIIDEKLLKSLGY